MAKYVIVSWYPLWYGFRFKRYYLKAYDWQLFIGFWEIRKKNKNFRERFALDD
jgi:hypothetical protein